MSGTRSFRNQYYECRLRFWPLPEQCRPTSILDVGRGGNNVIMEEQRGE